MKKIFIDVSEMLSSLFCNEDGIMERLHIGLIASIGFILMLGLACAGGDDFGNKMPYGGDMWRSDGFIYQLSYPGDCANRPGGTYCVIYSDNYVWHIPDTPADGVWNVAGYWHGKKVEVIHGKKADYYHVLGTALVKTVPRKGDQSRGFDKFGDMNKAKDYKVSLDDYGCKDHRANGCTCGYEKITEMNKAENYKDSFDKCYNEDQKSSEYMDKEYQSSDYPNAYGKPGSGYR